VELISLESINKKYGTLDALCNINIAIKKGSILGLLGPNGAGKTTIIRILTGILLPSSGQYLFEDKPIHKTDFRKIGYLPEERGLYKDMTVYELLSFLGQLKKMTRNNLNKKLSYWLERFELSNFATKKVHELSKGNQQKIQFITAILHDPELVILDEPFSGFDALNSKLAIEVILDLNQSGTTFILSTHQMHTVENLCSHVAMINKGKLILNSSVAEVKEQFKQNRIKIQGTGHLNPHAQTFRVLSENKSTIHEAILEQLPQYTSKDILLELMQNFSLSSFQQVVPGIEVIFIKALKTK